MLYEGISSLSYVHKRAVVFRAYMMSVCTLLRISQLGKNVLVRMACMITFSRNT